MEWKQTVWVPLLSAVVMGVVAAVVYAGLDVALKRFAGAYLGNAISTLAAVLLAVLVYFIAMIRIGGYTRERLLQFPKGAVLVKVVEKLHLI